jgi:hypothetical protein
LEDYLKIHWPYNSHYAINVGGYGQCSSNFLITNENRNYPSDDNLIWLKHKWLAGLIAPNKYVDQLGRVKNIIITDHKLRNILRAKRSGPFVHKDQISFITSNDRALGITIFHSEKDTHTRARARTHARTHTHTHTRARAHMFSEWNLIVYPFLILYL